MPPLQSSEDAEGVGASRSDDPDGPSAMNAEEGEPPEPGTAVNTIYESVDEFKAFVNAHSERVNPGSSLNWKLRQKYCACDCKFAYVGCRYEFHAAFFVSPEDGKTRLILTDVRYKGWAQLEFEGPCHFFRLT